MCWWWSRPGAPKRPPRESLLERLVRERVTRVVRPRPLSVAATAAVLALEYRVEVAPEFARACHEATRGNPFYVRELIHALQADGIDPSAAAGLARGWARAGRRRTLGVDPDRISPPRGRERRALSGAPGRGGRTT